MRLLELQPDEKVGQGWGVQMPDRNCQKRLFVESWGGYTHVNEDIRWLLLQQGASLALLNRMLSLTHRSPAAPHLQMAAQARQVLAACEKQPTDAEQVLHRG